jgi:hypothetical protein
LSVIVVVTLAIMGSASAFLWRAYGNNVPTFPSFGSTPPADAGDKVVVLKGLQAFQQQITAQTKLGSNPTAGISAGGDQASVRADDGAGCKIRYTPALGYIGPGRPARTSPKTDYAAGSKKNQ